MNDEELAQGHWEWMQECFKKEEENKKNLQQKNKKILSDYWNDLEWNTQWSKFVTVKDWQGTALSLGINPDSIIRKSQDFKKVVEIFLPAVTFTQEQAEQFSRRLRLVRNVAKAKGFFCLQTDYDENEINFASFATWALAENLVDKKAINCFEDAFLEKKQSSQKETSAKVKQCIPWEKKEPTDPEPSHFQDWYISARFFARELVKGDGSLLTKRKVLHQKIVKSLTSVEIYKRGKGKKPFDPSTISKALQNIKLN